ncbi:hypothetical protein GQ43DRAFT_401768 [Delitschia confertaspora ATCC 74209]|uniref:THO complex subunit 2 n=1 Tax=Delitschia confertaspora ATCC 74209 TaxID=1513339 RepID=A0A9P4MPB4_9PLEO|nr:hypothetical protein GQ43DRAFT_401768 [Delitschia confertaspora ATCC 74209]
MAPNGKRKRTDRTYSQDNVNEGASRPSPHRPQNLGLAHASQQNNGRGGRRSSRGGRGGNNDSQTPTNAMSPPAVAPSTAKPPPPSPAPTSSSADKQPAPSPSSQNLQCNEYLTSECVKSWRGQGRKTVTDSAIEAQAQGDSLSLSLVFEELVKGCLDSVLDAGETGSVVREILAAPRPPDTLDPVSVFLDVLSTLTETAVSNPSLRSLLEATGIDPARLRAELETPLLTAIPLVRQTFPRVAIRKATHALYRQSNYNLLREETEGYSKLITEYFTTVHNEPPSNVVASDTFQKVKALIGAFDLDVGRVLDVTLDVFANLLVKHNRFFIKFLRSSSWWPEQKFPNGIEWQDPPFFSLPKWASPESSVFYYTEEEKKELLELREVRDEDFWKRVGEVGLKAYFEIGARRITAGLEAFKAMEEDPLPEDVEAANPAVNKKVNDIPDTEKIQRWSREWMLETHTLPPPGNRIAAQLLGFKLRFYASDARDAHDTLPENLIYLAALLIKIGFISIVDLYPHLYPLDEDMPALRDRLMQEKAKEAKLRGATSNALAMAGALPDDTAPTPASRLREAEGKPSSKADPDKGTPAGPQESPKEKLPEPVDQKISLLRSLLCIGALPEAFYILGRFPWLRDVYPDLDKYIHRLLHHSLSKVYERSSPCPKESAFNSRKGAPQDASSHTTPRPANFVPRKTLRWAKLEATDAGDSIDYRFYWEDWADNVPVCQSVDDVFKLCKSLLNIVGAEVGKDPTLVIKLARIGKKSLAEDPSESNTRRWIELSATLLAPALSFTGRNPGIVNELFDLFQNFDIATRFQIYAHWFTGPASRKPAISAKFVEVKKETSAVLKRISATNSKSMARELAKVAYACPGIVFEHALRQIEHYGNLGDVVVECSRYFTYLAYDCMTWALINTLGREGRDSVQADGMLMSPWLRNASAFVGKVHKRYSLMSPTPVLQYVAEQLFQGDCIMLAVLEQLVTSMAGIGSDSNLTDSQIVGLGAGPMLRAFTLEHYLSDQRHAAKSTAKRLMRSLLDTGLAAQILIALAQELGSYIHRDKFSKTPPKVLGANLDNLHSVFAQYLDLLRSNLSVEEFDANIPDLASLISDFGIEPSIAFMISHDSLDASVTATRMKMGDNSKPIKSGAKVLSQSKTSAPVTKDSGGDIVMDEATMSPGVNGLITAENEKGDDDSEMKDTIISEEASTPSGLTPVEASPEPVLIPQFRTLSEQLQAASPPLFGEHISPVFYLTFWQLALKDLHSPTAEYDKARAHFLDKSSNVDNRRDVSSAAARKRDSDKKAAFDQSNKFLEEMSGRLKHLIQIRRSLKMEMLHWFDGVPMVDVGSEALHDSILQDCFIPRILLSPQDAMFSASMLKFMHAAGVPGFRTMKLLDQLFRHKLLSNIIFMCTSRESQNLGRFLADILKELKNWHDDKATYEKVALGVTKDAKKEKPDRLPSLPGFGKKFNADRTPASFLDYMEFRQLLYKWHSQVHRALEACLKSQEYMHIRNAINILKAISSSFPAVDVMGKNIQAQIEELAKSESREDLKLAAQSLLADFRKNAKTWVTPIKFRNNQSGPASSVTPSRTVAPQSTIRKDTELNSAKPLNTAAPEFVPKPATNGVATTAGNEHEDGEVDDEKEGSASTSTASAPRGKENESSKPVAKSVATPVQPKPAVSSQKEEPRKSGPEQAVPISQINTAPNRPDSRESSFPQSGRIAHALPSRPDAQTMPRSRLPERTLDRPTEYHGYGRQEVRNGSAADYGRSERPGGDGLRGGEGPRGGDGLRESFPDRRDPREASPRRPPRARSPDRGSGVMDRRDPGWSGRETRDYPDDRSMRPPAREARGPPGRGPAWGESPRDPRDGSRDLRDVRDMRDRQPEHRGPHSHVLDNRGRMPAAPPLHPSENSQYRRENMDRSSGLPPRPPMDRVPSNPPPALDRSAPGIDRTMVNPERVALIEGDRGRGDGFRSDGRDRESRPQSPRRDERPGPPPYQGRNEPLREHRDDRNVPDRAPPYERHPPHPSHSFPPKRDRRDDNAGAAPTGPRSGRNDFAEPPGANRMARDVFQSAHPPPRQPVDLTYGRLNQDLSHGRLNPPSDNIPSGPRGRNPTTRGARNFTVPVPQSSSHSSSAQIPTSPAANQPPTGPMSDRRDNTRKEPSYEQAPAPAQPPTPEAAPQEQSGIHPSRLSQIQPKAIQTDLPAPPSGPRPRGPQAAGPSPSTRGNQSGPPNSADRGARSQDKSFARTLHSVLNQGSPVVPGTGFDRNGSDRGASIRGRSGRGNGPVDSSSVPSPATSHPGTPRGENRPDNTQGRVEPSSQDGGRSDSRRDKRGERSSRRHRSRSPDRSERKGDDRMSRNEEPDRFSNRDHASGRDRAANSDRESGRRDRPDKEREGERPARDGRERRDRGSREEGRLSGRGEDQGPRRGGPPLPEEATPWGHEGRGPDMRLRGGGDRRNDRDRRGPREDDREHRDAGRKRGRGGDEGFPHGELKRPRRSMN